MILRIVIGKHLKNPSTFIATLHTRIIPWERGTNENTNALICAYFPKRTDSRVISDEELNYVEQELNERPRKRLGYKTPLQGFSDALTY